MIVSGITITLAAENVVAGVVVARGCAAGSSDDALGAAVEEAVAEAARRSDVQETIAAVRDLLRHGRYKPTGRGKPASEYLFNAAREGRFPRIGTLVDINNLVSLRSLLPISLIDIERAGATTFVIRRGRAGESYVFNPAGQAIELEDLLLVAHLPADRPCATAVKDSMETKLTESSRDVMAVIYAPPALRERLVDATSEFAAALERWSGARAATGIAEVIQP